MIGRFISTDPATIANTPNFYYSEPQNWNTHSYTTNNPVVYVDRDGEVAIVAPAIVLGIGAFAVTAVVTNNPAIMNPVYDGIERAMNGTIFFASQTASNIQKAGAGLLESTKLRWAGQRQIPSNERLGIKSQPTGPEDVMPNMRPDLPRWMKILIGTGITGVAGLEQYKEMMDSSEELKSFGSFNKQGEYEKNYCPIQDQKIAIEQQSSSRVENRGFFKGQEKKK